MRRTTKKKERRRSAMSSCFVKLDDIAFNTFASSSDARKLDSFFFVISDDEK